MAARHQRAEVRAHPRHRGGRQDHPARHVLPDERQLLLRRLLQGRRDRATPGSWSPAPGRGRLRPRPETDCWVTVYLDDDEATQLWQRDRRPPGRAHRAPRAWPTTTGPWASPARAVRAREIFYDRGPEYGAEGGPDGRRRPLPGDLEPRLHAVRARGAGSTKEDFDDPRRPAGQEHRHRAWASSGSPTLLQGVDNLYEIDEVYPVLERAAELAGKRYGAGPRRDDATPTTSAARGRRPRAHRADAHRRRRHPRQRGPRLRAAPDDAPRRPLDAPARRRRSRCLPELLPVSMDRMKQSYPELERDFGADLPRSRTPRRRRSGAPSRPARRSSTPRSARAKSAGRAVPGRRRGVPAARHLRLPDRPDPGDGGRAGRRGRRGRASAG